MATPLYPAGTVRTLLKTASVTAPTRQALQARLAQPVTVAPRFFDGPSFATLTAICDRLIPPIEGVENLNIAGTIDRMLDEGTGDGWRYDAMPTDGLAYRQGLQGMDQTACALFDAPFDRLEPTQQDSVLRAVQEGSAPGTAWETLPANRFFEELLAAAVQACYSHPLTQESIGYVGMADAPGWQAIGLDELEVREPKPTKGLHD